MKKLIDYYCQLMLPGLGHWPSYQDADTNRFWQGWQSRTLASTRFAVYMSVLLVHVYCAVLQRRGFNEAEAFAASEVSGLYLIRQSFTMIKSIACLAYFSDPEVHALSKAADVEVLVWRE